jgi:hypothetical protein
MSANIFLICIGYGKRLAVRGWRTSFSEAYREALQPGDARSRIIRAVVRLYLAASLAVLINRFSEKSFMSYPTIFECDN